MKKIEFSEEEKKVIRLFFEGEIEEWSATEDQQKHLSNVIDKAEARLEEYPDGYDFGDDLIEWIWDEYVKQEYEANGIVLTADELTVLKQHLNHEFGPFDATEYQKIHLSSVIDKAEDVMHVLDACEESTPDLLKWFYAKYKEQEANA